MRWFWIDRFVEFHSGNRASAVKCISLAEEHLHEYLPACPIIPHSLVVEGIAQTSGLLVGEHNGFRDRVVLAKLSKAVFHQVGMPGDTLLYAAVVEDIRPDGARVTATSHIGDELQAEVELVFAYIGDQFEGPLFYPANFLNMLRILGIYDIGQTADGQPLTIPEHLLQAERQMDGSSI